LTLRPMPVLSIAPAAASCLSAAIALLIAAEAFAQFRRVRGSTLAAPALWAVAAAFLLASVEAWAACRDESTHSLAASIAQYAAAVGTCCPFVAVLGAKRPQDRGWQWVVATLWLVLLVPAGQAIVAPVSSRLDLFMPWRLLVGGLAAMGVANYLPTRFCLPALVGGAGQTLVLLPWLVDAQGEGGVQRTAGLAAILAAGTVLLWASREGTSEHHDEILSASDPAEAFTHRWLAFRDAYGVFWALRVMQRINQSAQASDWPVRLQWSGFVPHAGEQTDVQALPHIDAQIARHVEQSLNMLLRRFERLQAS
jgi:hypothetical protein